MTMKTPRHRTTDYRPKGGSPPLAGKSSPLERTTARPGAAACPDRADPHALAAASYSDAALAGIIADIERRGAALRDYSNHEARWLGERMKALRAERRKRKTTAAA